ncbi:trehalose-6-phosphate synthase [Corynebacterium sp. 4HC-13]|uniref:alpha,alpha-trehalose-phosphate synthase (ADP-forming) n=1 Tax=Corynebacterium anserum TaxID=2684406 RepID=A0A7G7YQU0_9CORY|nr:trehalose-6-phosphate synthase [Corynebacterium anserum]MBC2681246.1 trehalose-6-phosphate synthase [Corynebacterium anserum]QNH96860.1 trehalose-6-phosphate synthase [Corynebacterium anserum]
MSADFVVVANRLPVDRNTDPTTGEVSWTPSPGGLVTALRPVLQANDGAWIGWPGSTSPVTLEDMPSAEESGLHTIPVNLDDEDFEQFYEGFSNATLWPLYHDLIVPPRYERTWWQRYEQVNQRFADTTAAIASEGATVWVQDYQLHLVPGLLRKQRGDICIGFFLHIPFPNAELFRQLPWREEVLQGTLGADVVGFHTQDSARNFLDTLRALGYDVSTDDDEDAAEFINGSRLPEESLIVGRVAVPNAQHSEAGSTRTVRVGVFPISIDSAQVQAQALAPETMAEAHQLRARLGSPKWLLSGVDRMDYTKGILHRLLAVEQLLDSGRLKAEDVVVVQVATPSRERLEEYRATREEVERVVSRINGNYGQLGRPLVHYIHHGLPFEEIVALYATTDIMLVTALKDGMNLVAKEYVASHSDGSGALVLSEFTGAATQLTQAYMCNPHDGESICEAILSATSEDPTAQRQRMLDMWNQVQNNDVDSWAASFLAELKETK